MPTRKRTSKTTTGARGSSRATAKLAKRSAARKTTKSAAAKRSTRSAARGSTLLAAAARSTSGTSARRTSSSTAKRSTGSSRARKRTPNAAFMAPLQPDHFLSAIVGNRPLPRTQVTKKLWNYIKKHDLQDATKRTMIHADANLRPVFGGKRTIDMFQMTKLVNQHLTAVN